MIEVKLIDGSIQSVPKEHIRRIVPAIPLLFSPKVKAPYSGLLIIDGKILPVKGGCLEKIINTGELEDRHWILVLKDHALLIQGLPIFAKDRENSLKESQAA